MHVYRIEHIATGGGPYTMLKHSEGGYPETSVAMEISNFTSNRVTHPTPRNDGIKAYMFYGSEWSCGFESIAKMDAWFKNVYDLLAENYFNVIVYEVDKEHVQKGNRQLIFDKTKALMVNTKMIGVPSWEEAY